jgi:hypothetical protein
LWLLLNAALLSEKHQMPILIGFTRSGNEPTIHHTQGGHASYYISDTVHFCTYSQNIYTPAPQRGRGYTVLPLSVCPSFRPSKIFFGAFFSVTVDGRNLIFGHKHHIGIASVATLSVVYCGFIPRSGETN